MDALRSHPRMLPLPPVSGLSLAGPDTFRWVRQDHPLWDELHEGVMTSRHLLSVLGFREPKAAAKLGLPRAVRQSNALAHVHAQLSAAKDPPPQLRRQPAEAVAAAELQNGAQQYAYSKVLELHSKGWPPPSRRPALDASGAGGAASAPPSLSLARCQWGSAQEASALASLLEALPAARMEEVGLAVLRPEDVPDAELREAAMRGELPYIGASPDGMLRRSADAPLEVVEIKCVTPFFESRRPGQLQVWTRYLSEEERACIPWYETRGPHDHLAAQYVPQVQLEMLATGARGGNYVSASAFQGLNVIRVARDDAYLVELLHFVRRFWATVREGEPPPPDFFWRGGESDRYEKFLERTVAIAEAATVQTHVRRPWRLRGPAADDRLFLDNPPPPRPRRRKPSTAR